MPFLHRNKIKIILTVMELNLVLKPLSLYNSLWSVLTNLNHNHDSKAT